MFKACDRNRVHSMQWQTNPANETTIEETERLLEECIRVVKTPTTR